MASIEDLLLMKAAEDAAAVPGSTEAALLGAGLGTVGGVMAGNDQYKFNQLVNRGKDAIAKRIMPGFSPVENRLQPGPRMAGGLVGLILGGGLGLGVRQMAINDSPAAALLAKAQVQGSLNPAETKQLESILREVYSEMGIRG